VLDVWYIGEISPSELRHHQEACLNTLAIRISNLQFYSQDRVAMHHLQRTMVYADAQVASLRRKILVTQSPRLWVLRWVQAGFLYRESVQA